MEGMSESGEDDQEGANDEPRIKGRPDVRAVGIGTISSKLTSTLSS
jgi:hypothetical protein